MTDDTARIGDTVQAWPLLQKVWETLAWEGHLSLEHQMEKAVRTVAEIQLFEWRGKSHQFSESGEVLLLDVFC